MSSNISVTRICEACGEEFIAKTTKTRFCSPSCNKRYYKAQQRSLKVQQSNNETFDKRIAQKTVERTDTLIKEIMTVKVVAEVLEYSKVAIYDLINSGQLKAYRPSIRKTRIKREDLFAYLEKRSEAIIGAGLNTHKQKDTSSDISVLNVVDCYAIVDLIKMFGKERSSLYRILRDGGVSNVRVGREVFYSKVESDKLFRKFSARKYIGYVGHRQEADANSKLAKQKLSISDCYSMDECERLFSDQRANLYGIFSRRQVPKLKEGVYTYYLKKSVDRIFKQRKEGRESE